MATARHSGTTICMLGVNESPSVELAGPCNFFCVYIYIFYNYSYISCSIFHFAPTV